MDDKKRKKLEAKGWKLGTAGEFLGLTEAEERYVEIKLALCGAFVELRRQLDYTQTQVAEQLGSSQSRVAKMEAGDRSVSIDLLVRGPLALGATRKDLALILRPVERETRKKKTRRQTV